MIQRALCAALFAAGLCGTAEAQTARILPPKPYVEASAHGPALNFDVLIENDSPDALTVAELEVIFRDGTGASILTRRLDGNGSAPSILTIPERSFEPGQARLIFNPFEHAPPGSEVGSVSVRLTLEDPEGETRMIEAAASVRAEPDDLWMSPVAGRVLVWDGHDLLSHHRRWDYALPFLRRLGFASNAMRYSYDFVPVDAEGRMHLGDGSRNEDWFGFGQPVRAPASGVVVQVRDDRPDDRSFDPAELAEDINLVFGNVVVIDHGDGTFSMLGHVRQGSATVRAGDRVEEGQRVAAVGASGSSLFPHLHYQRVDAPDMHGEGVPSRFRDVVLRDGRSATAGHVDSGDLFEAR